MGLILPIGAKVRGIGMLRSYSMKFDGGTLKRGFDQPVPTRRFSRRSKEEMSITKMANINR